ncbi:MAG TPA: post-transcriptional regulator [Bacillota bacterium]
MEDRRTAEEWKSFVTPALQCKLNDFHMMGYTKVTEKQLWDCLVHNVWKSNPKKRLHDIVHDIFHLSPNTYMNVLTLNAYQEDDLQASIAALANKNDESS